VRGVAQMSFRHMQGARGHTIAAIGACAVALALVAGCASPGAGDGSKVGAGSGSGAAVGSTAPGGGTPVDGPVVIVPESIPDGRTVSDGGNPEYTFRSLWKKALSTALEWKPDAYLVSAAGSFVNNDGVPSEWMMVFRTRDGSKDLRVRIDPWGKVTGNQESAPDPTNGTVAVPSSIIDSDEAVAKALPALTDKVSPEQAKDPRLGLGFEEAAGPFWYYIVLTPAADYVTVTLDAVTGDVVSVK